MTLLQTDSSVVSFVVAHDVIDQTIKSSILALHDKGYETKASCSALFKEHGAGSGKEMAIDPYILIGSETPTKRYNIVAAVKKGLLDPSDLSYLVHSDEHTAVHFPLDREQPGPQQALDLANLLGRFLHELAPAHKRVKDLGEWANRNMKHRNFVIGAHAAREEDAEYVLTPVSLKELDLLYGSAGRITQLGWTPDSLYRKVPQTIDSIPTWEDKSLAKAAVTLRDKGWEVIEAQDFSGLNEQERSNAYSAGLPTDRARITLIVQRGLEGWGQRDGIIATTEQFKRPIVTFTRSLPNAGAIDRDYVTIAFPVIEGCDLIHDVEQFAETMPAADQRHELPKGFKQSHLVVVDGARRIDPLLVARTHQEEIGLAR